MRSGTRRAGVWCTTVATLLLMACTSGSGSEAEPEPEVGPTPTVTSAAQLRPPLDAYRITRKDYIALQRAAWLLTRDCVRRFGGEYTQPESAVVANLPGFENDNDRRYGLFDPDSAAKRGYNVPPSDTGVSEPGGGDGTDPQAGKSDGWNPSAAELLLVRGVSAGADTPTDANGKPLPKGGCAGEADRTLAKDVKKPANDKLGGELSIQAHKRSEADSRVRAVMKRWSDCMARGGFTYQTVWEPNDYPWPVVAGETEKATAAADVRCKRETNLVGVWYAVETAYQRRLIDDNAEALTKLKDYVEATNRNAARVVGG